MNLYYWSLEEQDECYHYAVFAENEDQAWDELLKFLVASDYGFPQWPYEEFASIKYGNKGHKYTLKIYPVKQGGLTI